MSECLHHENNPAAVKFEGRTFFCECNIKANAAKIAELEKELAQYKSGGYHHWLECMVVEKDKIAALEKSLAESMGRERELREALENIQLLAGKESDGVTLTDAANFAWEALKQSSPRHGESSTGVDLEEIREALEDIQKWAKCYCLSDEESSTPGGKTCPTCIAEDALSILDGKP